MKQVLFLLLATAVIISCNDTANVAAANDDQKMGDNKNHENMLQVYSTMETGDVSKLDSIIADDVVDHNANPDGSDLKGRDSVKKMLGSIHTYFEDGLKVDMLSDATSPDGEYHFSLIRMKGKAKANPWGMPVGQEIDDTNVDVVKLKNGKATDHWGFMSNGDINEMMKKMQGPMPPAKDTNKK
jgi:ketosteroid isomerase-like protein